MPDTFCVGHLLLHTWLMLKVTLDILGRRETVLKREYSTESSTLTFPSFGVKAEALGVRPSYLPLCLTEEIFPGI